MFFMKIYIIYIFYYENTDYDDNGSDARRRRKEEGGRGRRKEEGGRDGGEVVVRGRRWTETEGEQKRRLRGGDCEKDEEMESRKQEELDEEKV